MNWPRQMNVIRKLIRSDIHMELRRWKYILVNTLATLATDSRALHMHRLLKRNSWLIICTFKWFSHIYSYIHVPCALWIIDDFDFRETLLLTLRCAVPTHSVCSIAAGSFQYIQSLFRADGKVKRINCIQTGPIFAFKVSSASSTYRCTHWVKQWRARAPAFAKHTNI